MNGASPGGTELRRNLKKPQRFGSPAFGSVSTAPKSGKVCSAAVRTEATRRQEEQNKVNRGSNGHLIMAGMKVTQALTCCTPGGDHETDSSRTVRHLEL